MSTSLAHEDQLARLLWTARSSKDVERAVRLATRMHGPLSWRPVGDRPNNIGTIGLGSDPALGLVERITNAMDALLDLGHHKSGGERPQNPREAAMRWYGVPRGGLAEMSDTSRRGLGEQVRVSLEESGDLKRPTVIVEDRGIGQSADDFPRTLLSLNEQNKVSQSWNMGTYGQGGSVTLQACEATIVMSRRHPDFTQGVPDRVGWTIVQRHMGADSQALPSYLYVVGEQNNVLSVDPSALPELEFGTRVIHIAYDLHGLSGPFTTGLWQFFHSAIFDPVLPFLITGNRKNERAYGSRIVIGNAARLRNPEKARGDLEIAHNDAVMCDLGHQWGSLSLKYWVVRRPVGSEVKSDPTAGYTKADAAVSITLYGQRQDTEARTWIKDSAKLPFLYKNIIVQIDADGLTPSAKGEIFASTRERARQGELRALIYDRLAEVLRNDDELKRLNHEEKERLLASSTGAASEKVRRRLAEFIKTRLKDVRRSGLGGTKSGSEGSRKLKPGGPKQPRNTDDTTLQHVPSRLAFVGRSISVRQGTRSHIWVELNAKNGYLPDHDDDLTLTWSGPGDAVHGVRVAMRSMLLGGRSRWYIEAAADAPLGQHALHASLFTANGILTDSVEIAVAPPIPANKTSKGTEPETGPKVKWVGRAAWADHSGRLDSDIVGYVTEDEEETIIWVNRDLDLLAKALAPRHLTADAIETRATRYQFPIACALWLQEQAVKSTDPRPSDEYQKAELRRTAEAVLVAIDPDVAVAEEEAAV